MDITRFSHGSHRIKSIICLLEKHTRTFPLSPFTDSGTEEARREAPPSRSPWNLPEAQAAHVAHCASQLSWSPGQPSRGAAGKEPERGSRGAWRWAGGRALLPGPALPRRAAGASHSPRADPAANPRGGRPAGQRPQPSRDPSARQPRLASDPAPRTRSPGGTVRGTNPVP